MKLGSALAVIGVAVLGGVAAFGAQGCTVTATNGPLGDAGFDFDTGNGGDSGHPITCNECLFQGCQAQSTVCDGDADCRAIYECAIKTAADVAACFCAHPAGQSKYLALSSCDSQGQCGSCQATCNTPPSACPPAAFDPNLCAVDGGAASDAAPPPADASVNDCNTCTATQCASQKASCAAGSACDTYTQCLAACSDATCATACDSNTDGKNAAAALATCTTTNCSTACGF